MKEMSDIQTGDIVFLRDNSLLSRTIRLVETGKFRQDVPSHVAIVLYNIGEELRILEAQFGGVREVNLSIYKNPKLWFFRINKPCDIGKGIEWAEKQIGKKYDIPQLIGIFLRGFWRLLGPKIYEKSRKIRNFMNSRQSFICSEYVALYGKAMDKTFWHVADSQVTPYDLFRSKELTKTKEAV